MNHSQRNLKKLIRAKEDSIADEELFLSAAYQKYQTSLARAVTGRYRYGLQVLLDWDISEQAGVAYTDNYKVHLNAANPITQSFPTRFLRSQSLTGLTGHEVGHLLYSDFTAHAVHLRSLENGSFYPKEPELSLPAYQTALEEIKEVLEEKDKAGCLTLARCAATFQNILEDIHIEDRMCEEFHGTFRQGIELNNLRMSEQIPSIQEQIDKEYQPFSIIANLILSYCRTGNINNPTGYQGDYLDTISDCTDLLDTAMESEKGTDRMLVSNALLALTWNYIQPLIEKTREELEMHGEDSAADSTDAGGVALYSYAEFDSVDNEDCYRLMDMCDRNGNRDGAALRFVAEHLCTRPELQKLLILISDGQPADYGYSGTEAEADLRGIKKEYEKRDVILFAAAIGDDKENIRRIYKDGFLDITKLEELPKNMAQLVKQHLK